MAEQNDKSSAVLDVQNLVKQFPVGKSKNVVNAINDVSFSIQAGETLGMVGESGSGKSTIARTVLRLTEPTSGQVRFRGTDLSTLSMKQIRPLRSDMQMVFQDPWSSLNPRMRIRQLIAEPLLLHERLSKSERLDRTEALAKRVHLSTELLNRFPSDLSGGQLQRVCIARAIATNPKLIILDEPTSSLDLSVRAGILELLEEIKQQTLAALLFISHDLGTVRLISDRIVVLYLGRIVEQAPAEALFEHPVHPYSQSLLSAHLPADPTAIVTRHILQGEVPSPINLPTGCAFHTRCPVMLDSCKKAVPALAEVDGEIPRQAACSRIADGRNWLNPEDAK
ncbi:MAG: oligopeptide/dipeptide ABC transporter ATP-binding protein [Granulosicoccus sp.]|jgi:oligopeptide/dipeptide ABC transporter ATP-binding protein